MSLQYATIVYGHMRGIRQNEGIIRSSFLRVALSSIPHKEAEHPIPSDFEVVLTWPSIIIGGL